MRRSVAKKLGMNIIGKFVTSVVVGVPPKVSELLLSCTL